LSVIPEAIRRLIEIALGANQKSQAVATNRHFIATLNYETKPILIVMRDPGCGWRQLTPATNGPATTSALPAANATAATGAAAAAKSPPAKRAIDFPL
jgi:hypothetical protein